MTGRYGDVVPPVPPSVRGDKRMVSEWTTVDLPSGSDLSEAIAKAEPYTRFQLQEGGLYHSKSGVTGVRGDVQVLMASSVSIFGPNPAGFFGWDPARGLGRAPEFRGLRVRSGLGRVTTPVFSRLGWWMTGVLLLIGAGWLLLYAVLAQPSFWETVFLLLGAAILAPCGGWLLLEYRRATK